MAQSYMKRFGESGDLPKIKEQLELHQCLQPVISQYPGTSIIPFSKLAKELLGHEVPFSNRANNRDIEEVVDHILTGMLRKYEAQKAEINRLLTEREIHQREDQERKLRIKSNLLRLERIVST